MEVPMTLENQSAQEPVKTSSGPTAQPIDVLGTLDPLLDEAAVRQATLVAEANNLDPQSLTLQDLAQVQGGKAPEVPQKFLKPDGAVDVDKIKASTEALDVAIQKKEEAVTKTVDDYMREYNERETKFRTMPNPERLAASRPVPPGITAPPQQENYEDVVRRDYIADPLATTARLIDLAIQQRFAPVEAREKTEAIRTNLQAIAVKDPRILREDCFAAVNAKLASDPDLWKLKNPHKAAWLEVKDEMHLGEPLSVQAQPSKVLSPVLGGGTPPSAPSSSVPSLQPTLSSLNTLDLRKKDQEAMGDELVRRALMGDRG